MVSLTIAQEYLIGREVVAKLALIDHIVRKGGNRAPVVQVFHGWVRDFIDHCISDIIASNGAWR